MNPKPVVEVPQDGQTGNHYPPWVILHIPHDSTRIPRAVRDQFVLTDAQLDQELLRMTDHHTAALFGGLGNEVHCICAKVSRLVVDVERFPDDQQEPMARIGMGVIYSRTSHLEALRRPISSDERQALLNQHYWPHHRNLELAVANSIAHWGRAVILDCHSFPHSALPYEDEKSQHGRPDICIGTDPHHTPDDLTHSLRARFEKAGWSVQLDHPFKGALVPASFQKKDHRVSSIMVEVNRRLYMNELNGQRKDDFEETAHRIRHCCQAAMQDLSSRSFNRFRLDD